MLSRYLVLLGLIACSINIHTQSKLVAQSDVAAKPIVGLRDNRPRDYALKGATVTIAPGQQIEQATVLIQGSSITAVGPSVEIPAGFMVVDCGDKYIYAGLIDAYSEIEVAADKNQGSHWNAHITPERNAASALAEQTKANEQLRSQGLTVRLVAPKAGIVKGTSCLVLLGDDDTASPLLKRKVWHHLQLTVPRGAGRPRGYPNSPMGAVALLRQTMHDASWYGDAWSAYRANTTLPRPEVNVALQTLADAVASQTFVFDAPNERMAIRAGKIADEFALQSIIRGSGREYRRTQQVAALNRAVLVPVNFPDVPDVTPMSQLAIHRYKS